MFLNDLFIGIHFNIRFTIRPTVITTGRNNRCVFAPTGHPSVYFMNLPKHCTFIYILKHVILVTSKGVDLPFVKTDTQQVKYFLT